jgi:murein L,D-transpeptidase YcbB/YkuD
MNRSESSYARLRALAALICLLSVSSVACQAEAGADSAGRAPGSTPSAAISQRAPAPAGEMTQLARLYEAQRSELIWFGTDGDLRRARRVVVELEAAAEHGLAPADYGVAALGASIAAIEAGERSIADIRRVDAALGAAMLRYLSDLREGRVPPSKAGFRYPAPRSFDPVALLSGALHDGDMARAVAMAEPSFPLYRRLRDALRRYRSIAAGADPQTFAPVGRRELGAPYPDAARLRRHLRLLGDMSDADAASAAPLYDSRLSAAVSRFQERHGLAPDGVLGKQTLAELARPLALRIRQIEFAMERLRWLPDMDGRPEIAVNVPTYRL